MSTQKIVTAEARLSFPWLFQAQPPMQPGGIAKFSAVLLFPVATDLSALKAAATEALNAMWPDPKTRPKNLRSPFHNGNEKELDGYKDHIYITVSSKSKPGVVDQNVQPIIDPALIYAGCYVRASVNAYAYNQAGNAGVSFGLMNIQKVRDGEPFGNRSAPEDDFTAVASAQKSAGAPAAKTAADSVDDWLGGKGEPAL